MKCTVTQLLCVLSILSLLFHLDRARSMFSLVSRRAAFALCYAVAFDCILVLLFKAKIISVCYDIIICRGRLQAMPYLVDQVPLS